MKAKFNTRKTNGKNKSKNGVPVVSLPLVRLPFCTVSLGKINCFEWKNILVFLDVFVSKKYLGETYICLFNLWS